MKITTFYRFPDLDARIGIHVDGCRVHIAFLAKGNAYRAGVLYKRNPDRTAAVDRLLPALDSERTWVKRVRIGKTANKPIRVDSVQAARKAYSKGGNYRFDVMAFAVESHENHIYEALDLEALGLIPCDNRPVPVAFGGAS